MRQQLRMQRMEPLIIQQLPQGGVVLGLLDLHMPKVVRDEQSELAINAGDECMTGARRTCAQIPHALAQSGDGAAVLIVLSGRDRCLLTPKTGNHWVKKRILMCQMCRELVEKSRGAHHDDVELLRVIRVEAAQRTQHIEHIEAQRLVDRTIKIHSAERLLRDR
jgi:hypothetical protein